MQARDLSSILAAVKRNKRSDQYMILAALYCLNAIETPVTVGDIQELLGLHVTRNEMPTNTSTSLRTYSTLVRLADKGPPLRWLLTEKGIARLRTLSGLPLPTEAEEEKHGIDIGIVCALSHPEFSAVIDAAGGPSVWRSTGNARFPHVYQACDVVTDKGTSLSVVGTTSTSMGLTAASIVTTQLIMQFRPRIVVMVGIAAGTRTGNKQFGDVLVADPSVDYNSGKVVRDEGIRDFLPDPYPIGLNPRLRSLLQKYRPDHPMFAAVRRGWHGTKPPSANRLHLGPLGAADQVIDDESRVLEIQRNWRKLIGVEMETYGVYRACYEAPNPQPRFVSFKSVCDFAAQKSDSWQDYAAYTAAQFAFGFLRAEWEALWPKA